MGRKDKTIFSNATASPIGVKLRLARHQNGISLTEMANRLGYTKGYLSGVENGSRHPSEELIQNYTRELGLQSDWLNESFQTELMTKPILKHQHFPEPFPEHWNIPYLRNPFFTGREDILFKLYNSLRASKKIVLSQPLAISGLGGIGKTQTAIEYAYRYRGEYKAIFWARADSQEVLLLDFLSIANLLVLPEKDEPHQRQAVAAVQRWLKDHSDWLFILDNVEDLDMIRGFIPSANRGHIILTTRIHAVGSVAQDIEIQKMGLEEGALFLLRRAKMVMPDAPFDSASSDDRENALAITLTMDSLPLALDQAGAYIEETNCGLSGYLNLYHMRRSDLLNRRGKGAIDHRESVTTTFSLSLEKVQQANVHAAELLKFCAFLYADDIPEEVFAKDSHGLSPTLQALASDPFAYNEAIGELLKYSLISRDSDHHTLAIHRIIQAVLKDGMDEETQQLWAERVIRAVDHIFPSADVEVWPKCQRYLPHAQVCAKYIEQWDMAFAEAARLLNQTGFYLTKRAQYKEAEPLLRQALMIREHVLDHDHPDMANNLDDLAGLCYSQGKYPEAEQHFLRALAIREKVLGPTHYDTGTNLNNLARLYRTLGRYSEAEPLYLRALNIYEQSLGSEHPDTATVLKNLATLYSKKKKYDLAEPLLLRSLAINEKVQGLYHLDTAASLNNLARLYSSQSKYSEAESLYLRALAIREEVLGPEHPSVAKTLENYADLLQKTGRTSSDRVEGTGSSD